MSGVPPDKDLERQMNQRTIPALAAGVMLAAGLLTACGTSTTPSSPTTAATTEATPAMTAEPTAGQTATATPTAQATNVVAEPSAMAITVADGKVSGVLTVKGTNQGVADAEVNLVFRPDGNGVTPQIVSVKTDGDGKFATTTAVSGAGTWTASFLGNNAAMAAVAAATVG